jgi:threonine aldolase
MVVRNSRIRGFASDTNAGICPEAWEALDRANRGHAPAYGFDSHTQEARAAIQDIFATDCQVYFVFTGSAANSLAVAHLCRSYELAICHETAHLDLGECGGPEFFSGGSKVLPLPGEHGKLDAAGIRYAVETRTRDFQYPAPRLVSLTQATEMGTVYSLERLREISDLSRELGLRVHMDGARLANALIHLDCEPADTTWRAGVDVLSFGCTKNGLHQGEAVVFFDRELASGFEYRWKQSGQVASKMRFLSAPWTALLKSGAWLRNARHANACAARLERGLRGLEGISIPYPREANGVFVRLKPALAAALRQRGWTVGIMPGGAARFMCSWDTRDEDVDALIHDFRDLGAGAHLNR